MATRLWKNTAGTNSWFDAANWSAAFVPTSIDTANITDAVTSQALINGNASVTNLNIDRIGNSLLMTAGSLNVSGTMQVGQSNGNGAFIMSVASSSPTATATVNSLLVSNGAVGTATVSVQGNSIFNAGSAIIGVNATGVLQVANGATFNVGNGTGTLFVGSTGDGTLEVASTLSSVLAGTVNAATIDLGTTGSKVNFSHASATANVFSAAIVGTGFVTKSGSGTTILTGFNTYFGTTTISAGVLQIGNEGTTGTIGTGAVSIASGANLTFARTNATTVGAQITGAGSVTLKAGGNVFINNTSNTFSGGLNIEGGAAIFSTAGNLGSGSITFNKTGAALVGLTSNGTTTLSNTLNFTANKSAFINASAGQNLTLSGTANYLGGNSITFGSATQTGTVTLAHSAVSVLGNGSVTIGGGLLTMGSNTGTTFLSFNTLFIDVGGTLNINGFNTGVRGLSGGGNIINSSGTPTTFSVSTTAGSTIFSGTISGTVSLTKTSNNVLTLTGANSYSGTTLIAGGTLQLGNGGSLGSLGSGIIDIATGANLTISKTSATTIANQITGGGSVTLKSGGTVTLTNAANSFTGGINIEAGIASFNTASSLGTGAIRFTNTDSAVTAMLSTTSAVTVSNGLSFNANSFAQIQGSTSNTVTLTGSLDLRINANVTFRGNFVLSPTVGSTEQFSNITIGTGSLKVGTSGGAVLLVHSRVHQNADTALDLNGFDTSLASLSSTGVGARVINSGAAATLTVNPVAGLTSTYTGAIVGALTLTKTGAGTLVLTGDSSYTGVTFIDGGTLQVTAGGSILNSLGVSVGAAGTFDITGSTDAAVIIRDMSNLGNVNLSGEQLRLTNARNDIGTGTFTGSTSTSERLTIDVSSATYTLANTQFLNWTSGQDFITINGNALNNTLTGSNQADTIDGSSGNDVINGLAGADILIGGTGNDTIDGGEGADTAVFSSTLGGVTLVKFQGTTAVLNRTTVETDRVTNVETLQFSDTSALPTNIPEFRALDYIASHNDLINAFGANASIGFTHFINNGFFENRAADTFRGLDYIASHSDLISALGSNEDLAAQHFITNGFAEGRARDTFRGLDYIASHDDLIRAFGSNEDLAALHFVNHGFAEGRARDTFDARYYLGSFADLRAAIGTNEDLAALHFVSNGFAEGRARNAFDALEYIASHNDLISAFGANAAIGDAHFITNGFSEGRGDTFDGLQYIASHGDLIRAFGLNATIGTTHFITNGFSEGRSRDNFDAAHYLASHADLQAAFGTNLDAATRHYIQFGFFEGRTL